MSLQYALENGRSKLYSAWNPNTIRVQADIHGASMTRQEFTDECDVNAIMRRYEASGIWPFQPQGVEPVYVDFYGMPDLQGAMASMIQAEEAFMRLPALVRKEFDNDAMRFVEYAQDGNNVDKLREWGLAEPKKPEPSPIEVRVVKDPESPPIAPAKV
uniref:Portal protein n=1 Tax=Gokushovirinae environmental samples TaxID=1478972 RepID=A0A2R3UAW0_9VIRU|nr:portal protein [Gokushovirinae environmental samples]